MYYVYAYCDPRVPIDADAYQLLYQPFYIGLGKGARIDFHIKEARWNSSTNPHKSRKIKQLHEVGLAPVCVKIQDELSLQDASALEIEMISYYGRQCIGDGILTNISGGGSGGTDHLHTTKNKLRQKAALAAMSDEKKREIADRLISHQIHIKHSYTLKKPDGSLVDTDNLTDLCNDYKISIQSLYRTMRTSRACSRGRTAGWQVVSVKERER